MPTVIARCAPASTTTRPSGMEACAIHSRRLGRCGPVGASQVPRSTGSSDRSRRRGASSAAAMIVAIPEAQAIVAAWIFVRIPPVPSEPPRPVTSTAPSCSGVST